MSQPRLLSRESLRRRQRTPLAAWLLILTLAILTTASARTALAQTPEERVRQIASKLQCPICESVSVADSPSELAVQMRALIRKRVESGESEQQIVDYFVAAYGDSVLLEPPRRGIGWLVWIGPFAGLALGAIVVVLMLKRWIGAPQTSPVGGRSALTPNFDSSDVGEERAEQAARELNAVRREQQP